MKKFKYELINTPNEAFTGQEQVMFNRGIKEEDFDHFMNLSNDDLHSPLLLDNIEKGWTLLSSIIHARKKILLIVDSDADGYLSSAIVINWLNEVFDGYGDEYVTTYFHEGKQHGMHIPHDQYEPYDLIIVPDAGSNDFADQKAAHDMGIPVLVLDHHESEPDEEENAIIINNQMCDYPNKFLCGGAIVYKFFEYADYTLGIRAAERYLDLVALSLVGDMMSLSASYETKYLIDRGLQDIHNPFFAGLVKKNSYSIFKKYANVTPISVAFYVTPFINAHVRSGTMDEKKMLFDSLIESRAYKIIPSTKRGAKPGEEETLLDKVLRTATSVKKRQTDAQNRGMDYLRKKIEENDMMQNRVLCFLIPQGVIDKNIAGLVANKIAPEYQRPTCILTECSDNSGTYWQGSARGCDVIGVDNFKDICEETGVTRFVAGHQGAFGLAINDRDIQTFTISTNKSLIDMPSSPKYFVDYIFDGGITFDQGKDILDIAAMGNHWGKDFNEPYVVIKDLLVDSSMINLYQNKTTTLNIKLKTGISMILFGLTKEQTEEFTINSTTTLSMTIVGKCEANEFQGRTSPQISITKYSIDNCSYAF